MSINDNEICNLIKKSAGLQCPIVVKDDETVKTIQEIAKEMDITIPIPISVDTMIHGIMTRDNGMCFIGCHVLVHNPNDVLQKFIMHFIRCEILQ